MQHRLQRSATLFLALASMISGTAYAEAPPAGDWHYGIGTGISSFGLDGDLGFATDQGGIIREIDLENDDTSDLVDSAFGLNGFASNGRWDILLAYGTVTLEDGNSVLDAEWERTVAEVAVVYNFCQFCNSRWGLLFGARATDHEWKITSRNEAFDKVEPGDDWNDFIIGLSHVMTISDHWAWRNRADAGFGDTEEAYFASTSLIWQPFEHWQFNINAKYIVTDFGDDADINDSDFYLYNVDDTSFGLGVSFVW